MTILADVKDSLFIHTDDFDTALLNHINTALSELAVGAFDHEFTELANADTDIAVITTDRRLASLCTQFISVTVKQLFDPSASATVSKSYDLVSNRTLSRIRTMVEVTDG